MTERKWYHTKLGELIETNSKTYSKKEGWEYINYLDTKNITDNRINEISELKVGIDKIPSRAKRKVKEGDVIFSTVRPNQRHFGIIKSQPANFLVSTGFTTIRAKPEKANSAFIYWYLSQPSVVEFLHGVAETSTSAYPSIKPSDIEGLEILLPPLAEQKTIAAILGALDDKIDNNNEMNKTLEEMTRSIFKSWFIDFDPVHTKVSGNSPAHMDTHTASLFPNSFSDDGLPTGWKRSSISNFAFRVKDKFEKNQSWDNEKLIDLGRMPNNSISLNKYGEGKELSTSVNIFKKNDFLFGSIRPYFRKAGIAPFDGITNSSVFIIRCHKKKDNAFLYSLCSSKSIFNKSIQFSKGTKMPIISWTDFSKFEYLEPSNIIKDKFSSITLPIFEKIQKNILESQTLVELRDTLLSKLMSGEIRVKDAAREVEAAI